MATSNSYDYNLTAGEIVQAALEDLLVYQAGETVDAEDSTIAMRTLNLMVKQWMGTADMAPGLRIFLRERVYLFPQAGKASYLVGPAATDDYATTRYGQTTLSADEAALQTTISITSNADTTSFPGTTVTMTDGDFVGIELDDGSIQWTTIDGTPGETMVIDVALTGPASQGNFVYWFTSRAQRFLNTEAVVLRDLSEPSDMLIHVYRDVYAYESLTNKQDESDPTAVLMEYLRLNTRVTLNAYPYDMRKILRMTVLYPTEDYDATTNDIAYPQGWLAALEWELALRLAPKFGKPWTPEMQMNYQNAVGIAKNINPENSSFYFQPGLD